MPRFYGFNNGFVEDSGLLGVMLSRWVGVTRCYKGATFLQCTGKHVVTQHHVPEDLSPQASKDYLMGQAVCVVPGFSLSQCYLP